MLKKDQLLQNDKVVKEILDEIFIYKKIIGKSTNNMNNHIFLKMVEEGFINVEGLTNILISIGIYNKVYYLNFQERRNRRWYTHSFNFTDNFIQDWLVKNNG